MSFADSPQSWAMLWKCHISYYFLTMVDFIFVLYLSLANLMCFQWSPRHPFLSLEGELLYHKGEDQVFQFVPSLFLALPGCVAWRCWDLGLQKLTSIFFLCDTELERRPLHWDSLGIDTDFFNFTDPRGLLKGLHRWRKSWMWISPPDSTGSVVCRELHNLSYSITLRFK